MIEFVHSVHFVGIGGSGMCGVAEILKMLGFEVSGSDCQSGPVIDHLITLGCKVSIGHKKENIDNKDVIVVSSAIDQQNPELLCALERGIPIIPRAEMLSELMRIKTGIAIAGTHGKTTITSITASILSHADFDPTFVIGGRYKNVNSNARLGKGKLLIVEADESDGSFLKFNPIISVISNIEADHMQTYDYDIEKLKQAFITFANKVPFYGVSILNKDDRNCTDIISQINRPLLTFAIDSEANLTARDISFDENGTNFTLFIDGIEKSQITTKLIGFHNVYNCLAALSVAYKLNTSLDVMASGLKKFEGVERRCECRFRSPDLIWYDDYGHHPSEIKATLSTLKSVIKRRLVVCFQPHRFSRTRDLFDDFLESFCDADILFLDQIYPASEQPIAGINSTVLGQKIKGTSVTICDSRDDMLIFLKKTVQAGDCLLTIGAGDIWKIGQEFCKNHKG